jgi:hypothetical protein
VNRGFLSMSHFSTLDRESFQKFLANAYAVQQSQVDSQSLSAIVEIQRLITTGDLAADEALHLIVDRTQNIANATGVAVGLLKGDQLVYRAGSGSAATYTGRSMTARLVVSADSKANCEILRVENVETDARIEAAICRQFGAVSLLILLICHDHAVAGVLEIFFDEAHVFQDSEVRAYRLMAGLVGESISHAARLEKKVEQTQKETVTAKVPTPPPASDESQHEIYAPHGRVTIPSEYPVFEHSTGPTAIVLRLARRVFSHNYLWNRRLAAVVTIVLLTCWIAYSHRRPAPSLGPSAGSTVTGQLAPLPPSKALPAKDTSDLQTGAVREADAKATGTAARRVRVSDNEVDYIKDDVTVRYFTPKPPPRRARVDKNEVAYIGDDVTVRHFKRKPAPRSSTSPIGGLVQPTVRSWSTPANSSPSQAAK